MTTDPARAQGATDVAPDEPASLAHRPHFDPRGAILIVEDEVLVREVTVEALVEAGFVVAQAANGEEALRMLGSTPLAALVTDVMMPGGLDGVAVASIARRLAPELPVLVVSACHDHPRLKDLPPRVPFLGKPYTDSEIACAVRALVAQVPAAAAA